jgi:hypothetical protein
MEWLIFAAGVLVVGVSLFLGYRERHDFARLQERAGRTRPGELEELSLVVSDLEHELTQTAERIIQDLEERTATLRRLIAEAKEVSRQLGVPDGAGAQATATALEGVAAEGSAEEFGPRSPGERGWRSVEATVWEMSQRGLGVEQIARQLEIGKGEVKLILDLKKAQVR